MAREDHPCYGITEQPEVEAVVIAHIENGGAVVRYLFTHGPDDVHNHSHSEHMRYEIGHHYDPHLKALVCVRTPKSRVTTSGTAA